MSIVIIDYGAGNIKSIANVLDKLDADYTISANANDILNAKKIIFPGQGNFAQAMNNLTKRNLIEPIKEAINKNIPFLGICLGLQILFEESEEAPNVKGLSIFKGKVKKFQNGKIPQIGWNKVYPIDNKFLKEDFYYYVNSYYVEPDDKKIIYATSDYYQKFCCAVKKDNLIAVQFHPEKSAKLAEIFFGEFINL
ncbi:imidazole glycerol phosphate synthase subunit HisH [bacterium]|nr:imidazole glycerol phosphate synthase subunit HisH [bacterium]